MFIIFTIPEYIVASSTYYIGDIFSDAGVLIALAIGFPLAFYVIRRLIKLTFREPKGYPYKDYLKESKKLDK